MYSFMIPNFHEFNYFMEMRTMETRLKVATSIIERDFHCGIFEHDNFDPAVEKKWHTNMHVQIYGTMCII